MSLKQVYLCFAVIGAIVPGAIFSSYFMESGLGLGDFFGAAFANKISTALSLDILIASFVFWAFLFREAKAHGIRYAGLYIAANLGVGLCFAFPLFLYVRERALEKSA